jgi:hypothetical protein
VLIKNQENIDFLAEVIASHLVANKMISDADIYVQLLGVFRRFFSKDVEKIQVNRNDSGEEEWNLFLHREGFYDLLPEGFFHSHPKKYFKDRRETIEEFRLHRNEEKSARQFFRPLEQEFFKHLIHKEIFEQNFYYAPETIQEFVDFYHLGQLDLNIYQKASLFFIMPYASLVSGNLSLTETCFEIILQEKVRIQSHFPPVRKTCADSVPGLGNNFLGRDSLLGKEFIDGNPQLVITIGPLSDSDTLLDFLFGMKRKLIDSLAELFIQADLITNINVLLKKPDEAFVMGERSYESRLNYSTFL